MKSITVSGLALAAGMCLGGTAFGQSRTEATPASKEQRSEERPRSAEQATTAQAPQPAINIDFPGGTLREYVAVLRDVTKPNVVNVVAPETVLKLRLGEVSLREVAVKTAVESVEWAMEPRGTIQVQQIGPNAFGLMSNRRSANTIEANATPAGPVIQVLSLRELTDPLPSDLPQSRVTVEPDVVLTAVRTAIESSNGEAAELKFHSDSGLLIVRGTPDQVQTAETVLDRMRTDMRLRRTAVKEAAAGTINIEELKAEAEKHAIRHRFLEKDFERASAEWSRAEQMQKQGLISQGDYNAARASLDRTRAEMETSRIDAATSQARVESVGKRMAEAAGHQRASAGPIDFPAGRSTVSYASLKRSEKEYLTGVGQAASLVVSRLMGKDVPVIIEVEGSMLKITADAQAHRVIHRVLIDPSGTNPIFQIAGKPQLVEEKNTR